MTAAHTELRFEEQIVEHLAGNGWLYEADNSGYDKVRALYPADIRAWLEDTQPEMFAKVVRPGDDPAAQQRAFDALLDDIAKQLDTPLENGGGTLSVLRKPVRHRGNLRFDMCQAKPADSMNPTTLERYAKVRLRVMRQVYYSTARKNRSIDLVLLVNGLPIATIELKTDFTQSVTAGEVQYAHSRQPTDPGTNRKEPLLTFGARALVHFVVTNSVVSMTTKLDGPKTVFLPFNKGHNDKGGNPPNPNGSATSYFWEEVLDRDTWLTIVMKYMMVKRERKTDPVTGKKKTSVSIRFPRYHQLDVVEKLVATTRDEGPGHRYLIEHSAGSGKTDSIAWTAHRLAALHDDQDRKVFDSVIVVTDRTVLDSQISEAMLQIEHKASQVASIGDDKEAESKSKELAKALADRTPIVVVTIQTFPYALDLIAKSRALAGRRFAVIADEAHSSQTGMAAAKLKVALSPEELAALEDGGEIDVEAILAAEMTQRAEAKNISYYAFTATPKAKTLELFGRPGPDGKPAPFHRYTMSQAIDEGFILDVLRNYTPYKVAFKLVHDGQDYDSEKVDKSRALKSLMQWVRLHPYNISQKVAIIVEHYRANIAHLLDGNAKAMVVTGSRKEAVRYQKALQAYISEKGYQLKPLVAFSGKVTDPEVLREGEATEKSKELNPGLGGREIADAFNGPEYQVLIVANKFQVGFDQPLLCAMYVDKKLSGVLAVQTLSRLNRTYPGKDNVYILDFVNDPEDILEAFKPYYRGATLLETTDPNIIHRIADKLDESRLYTPEDIDKAAEATLRRDNNALSGAVSGPRQRFLDARNAALDSGDTEELERLEMFRSDLAAYVKAYDFLSQIIDYSGGDNDAEMEKRAIFYRTLHEVVRKEAEFVGVDLSGVVMTHYRLEEQEAESIDLDRSQTTPLTPLTELGGGQLRDSVDATWAEIIEHVNAMYEGSSLEGDTAAQLRTLDAVLQVIGRNTDLGKKAKRNKAPDFYGAAEMLRGAFLKAAVEAQVDQSTATEVYFQQRNADRLVHFLEAIGLQEWLIKLQENTQ